MQQIVTKEMLDTVEKGAKGLAELAKAGSTTIVDETVKLFIFYGVVGILKAAVVFVVLFIVFKFFNTMMKATEDAKETKLLKSCKTFALIASIIYFVTASLPHIMDMGKVMVAPNLFLAEKGIELVTGKK